MKSDVCVVLEGCYPFVTGGVSQWIQMLMESLPELTFSVLVISPDHGDKTARYQYPPNVVEVVEAAIERPSFVDRPSRRPRAEDWAAVRTFHEAQGLGDVSSWSSFLDVVHGRGRPRLDLRHMLEDPSAFSVIRALNAVHGRLSPLLAYFHTWRSTHFPLFHLLRARIPEARVYHAISTGYAGFVGAVAKYRTGSPLLLTEHGLYTKEREMEVMRADWIDDGQKPFWVRYFNALGRWTYEAADEIVALFEVNRRLQVGLGAPEERCRVIPNGIRLEGFAVPERKRTDDLFRIGLIGRVTPIKDVKTYVKACALVARKHLRARFYVLGPWEEDPDYAQECRFLAKDLGVEGRLEFTGKVDVRQWYPNLDLVVLSSVKEAQPLVLIEAMAAGVPSVSTNVGGVAETVEGSGLVVNAKRPSDMAAAIGRFIEEPAFHDACAQAGIVRARAVYSIDAMVGAYRTLYRRHLDRARKTGA